jgi:hypothetical protein
LTGLPITSLRLLVIWFTAASIIVISGVSGGQRTRQVIGAMVLGMGLPVKVFKGSIAMANGWRR